MSTYIVNFTLSEEILVEAESEDAAVYAVKEALRNNEYPLNLDRTFIHGKALDEIKRLP